MKNIVSLFIFFALVGIAEPSIKIDNMYFKKVHSDDPGTIYIFLTNATKEEIKVDKLHMNDIEIKEGQMTDKIYWWTQIPNSILPDKTGSLIIKIKNDFLLPVKLKLELSNGEILVQKIEPIVPEFFRITSVSFDLKENKIYIYVENNFPSKPIEIKNIIINGENVTKATKKLGKFILPGEKGCIIYKGSENLIPGEYVYIKVTTTNAIVTERLVKIYSYFPIQDFGKDNRKEMFFNEDTFDIHFPTDLKEFEEYKSLPYYKVYHLFDDPTCNDEKKGYLGANAKEVIKRRKICWEKDPIHPTMVYICEFSKPLGYFIYGELVDIVAVDPYELTYYSNPPEMDGEYVKIAKKAGLPRPVVAIPEAFRYVTPKFPKGSKRFPTSEEERLIVYSEIAEGAKGLWYYVSSGTHGYKNSPELEKEIGEINKEIQYLKGYLVIGEPMNIAETDSQSVKADGIFCGDKGIVIILRNGDYKTTLDKEKNKWETTVEDPGKINIIVKLPMAHSYQIESIESINDRRKLLFKRDFTDRRIIIEKDKVKIAEPVLIKFKEGPK